MNTKRLAFSGQRPAAAFIAFLALACTGVFAQVPGIINHQGRVTVAGTNFTGAAQFKFALINNGASQTYWSNGVNSVSLNVTKGLYSVALGNTNLANMAALPATVFTNAGVRLRVWFDDGTSGLQQLGSDQRLAGFGYAMMSANVPDGAIASGKIADGAVTSAKIAAGAVGSAQLAAGAVQTANIAGSTLTAAQFAPGSITGVQIASNAFTAANLVPGIGLVPSSTFVLSPTAGNAALLAAGYAPQLTLSGTVWNQATNAAAWSARTAFGATTFNGQLWVLGGYGFGYWNDVWSSSNGVAWTQATNAAPWSARYGLGAVAFNGQLWVMGGFNGLNNLNDVWSSSNGVDWTQVTNAAPWSGRYGFGAVAFNNQLWVLGGYGAAGYLNDVWSSSNGVTWTQATSAAPWTGRNGHGALVFDNKLWVLGGNNGNRLRDVWSSSNGVSWTQATGTAPWSARHLFGAVAFDGKMCVLGGMTNFNNSGYLRDVWLSGNGATWTQVTNAAPWSARSAFGAMAHDNKLWVMGGEVGFNSFANDAWFSPPTSTNMLGSFYLYQKQ